MSPSPGANYCFYDHNRARDRPRQQCLTHKQFHTSIKSFRLVYQTRGRKMLPETFICTYMCAKQACMVATEP